MGIFLRVINLYLVSPNQLSVFQRLRTVYTSFPFKFFKKKKLLESLQKDLNLSKKKKKFQKNVEKWQKITIWQPLLISINFDFVYYFHFSIMNKLTNRFP